MKLETLPVGGGKELTEFIRFPRHLYRDSKYYVPHLEMERKDFFNTGKNPFFSNAEVAYFLVRDSRGKTLGRISAHIDRSYIDFQEERTGLFGFFDAVDDPEAARVLFEAAESFLRERGMAQVLGPMSFTTNDEVGALVKGFDSLPYIMMPYNFPYYESLITGAGYEKARDLFAYRIAFEGKTPTFVSRISKRVCRGSRITVRSLNLKDFAGELELVKKIYNAAWEKNWGFVPMTEEQIDFLAHSLKPLIDPFLVHFAFVDGEPAGFIMALPDYNIPLKKMNGTLFPFGLYHFLTGRRKIHRARVMTLGVLEKYRKAGVEMVLLNNLYEHAKKRPYREYELSWILEDNRLMTSIADRLRSTLYSTYRTYSKKL